MILTIKIPESLENVRTEQQIENWRAFLQAMTNRMLQGGLRYGKPDKRQNYLSRLEKEWEVYSGAYCAVVNRDIEPPFKYEGNFEQLLNIAVYCWLESEAPQHPRFHFDNNVGSVTRDENI